MNFSKTVSVVAALASIFAAGATGWKLAQDNQVQEPQSTPLEQKIQDNQLSKWNNLKCKQFNNLLYYLQ